MVKKDINRVVSNPKFSIVNSKISLNIIARFLILIINNKYSKNAPILQFLLNVSTGSKGISCYFFCWKIENLNGSYKSDKNKIEEENKLEDKINWNKLIYQVNITNSQYG